jgi:hypothetical protein
MEQPQLDLWAAKAQLYSQKLLVRQSVPMSASASARVQRAAGPAWRADLPPLTIGAWPTAGALAARSLMSASHGAS